MKYFSPFFSYIEETSRVGAGYLGSAIRKRASGHENGPAADLSGVEVVQGVHGAVQRVLLGVQGDLSGLREHHQLGQVGVGADDVADDVLLAGDEVQRRDEPLAPVMCQASISAPCSATKSSTTVAPPPVMSLTAATWSPSATTVSSAPISAARRSASGFLSTTITRVPVSALRHWMPMCPRPPAPCTTAVVPGGSSGTAFRTAWYAVMPASASAATSAG